MHNSSCRIEDHQEQNKGDQRPQRVSNDHTPSVKLTLLFGTACSESLLSPLVIKSVFFCLFLPKKFLDPL